MTSKALLSRNNIKEFKIEFCIREKYLEFFCIFIEIVTGSSANPKNKSKNFFSMLISPVPSR
jgi:hypothetical protein